MKKWKDRSQQQTKKTHNVLDNMIRKREIDEKLADYIYIKHSGAKYFACFSRFLSVKR